jgi:hypothetical protein
MTERQLVLEEISKLSKSERITYFIGDEIFKNIMRIVLPKCIELVNIPDDVIHKITFMEALDHKPIKNCDPHRIFDFPWATIINEIHDTDDDLSVVKPKFIYDVRWSYYKYYIDVMNVGITPLQIKFYIGMIIGLIHELRHIYQYESGKYFNTINDFKNRHTEYQSFVTILEEDAEKYASDLVSSNIDSFKYICQQQLDLYQYKIDNNIIDLDSYK